MQIYYHITPDKMIEITLYNDTDDCVGSALYLDLQDANKLLNAIQNAIDEIKNKVE